MNNLRLIKKHAKNISWNKNWIYFDESSLDALLAEHLAVNSGEPIYEVYDETLETWAEVSKSYVDEYKEDKLRIVYTANPLNQELLDAVKSLQASLEWLLENTEKPPLRNCSCHISPPCGDCVDYSSIREAIEMSEKSLASLSPNVIKLIGE